MKTARLFFTTLALLLTMPLLFSMTFGDHAFQQKETRNVETFTVLGLAIDADVILSQGNECSLSIDAEPDILKRIITEVKNGTLRIKYDHYPVPKHEKITVYVTMKEIKGFALAGSGNIIAEGAVSTDELELAISGSGDIRLSNLTVSIVDAAISGSGNILLGGNGKVSTMEVAISGSGGISCETLEVESMEIAISGSGNCKAKVTGTLEASISGSGNVTCTGYPRVNTHISGSGRVIIN